MGIAERKVRQKETVRSAILKATWNLVEREGWQALSIRKIADAIEYSVPVIYDHFENKEAIKLEFARQGFEMLFQEILKAQKRFIEPEKQIEAMAYNYWDFAFNNIAYYQLMYGLGMSICETVKQIGEIKMIADLIAAPIQALLPNDNNGDKDAFLKVQAFWSMLHGRVSMSMIGNDNIKEEENNALLRDLINNFIAGLKS